MSDKITSLNNFSTEYRMLTETDKREFSKIVSKLLNETFIVKDKESDRADYLFARENIILFTSYFEITDYEFINDRYNELCYIKTTENRNRVKLYKFDTAIILILRQFYYIKRREVATDNKVVIKLEDIIEKVKTSKIFKDEKKINAYKESLIKLRKHKIIDYTATTIDESLPILIYPSIQIIVQQDKLENITDRLSALRKESEDTGENIDENVDED
jgi:hypothetical protein